MHLISYGPKLDHFPFYQKRSALTRVDSLAYFFRRMRIHRNLTKKALSEKFSVSEEYVSAIESGSKFPSLNFCLKCGDEFGANPSWVKTKWAKESIDWFTRILNKRLGLDW